MGFVTGQRPTWTEEIQWCARSFTGNFAINIIRKLIFNSYVYHIWKERNERIFTHQHSPTDQVSWLIIQDVKLKIAAYKIDVDDTSHSRYFFKHWNIPCIFNLRVELRCHWMRPEGDAIMINTDGSLRDGLGGYGSIIRDNPGSCLMAFAGPGMAISLIGIELPGVQIGLRDAVSRGFRRAHLCLDSQDAVVLLNSYDPDPPWNVLYIWRHIVKLRRHFDWLKIEHIYRETNRAVDWLAGLYPLMLLRFLIGRDCVMIFRASSLMTVTRRCMFAYNVFCLAAV